MTYRERKQREFYEKTGQWKPYQPGKTKIVSNGPAPRQSALDAAKAAPSIKEDTKPRGYEDMLRRATQTALNTKSNATLSTQLTDQGDVTQRPKKRIWSDTKDSSQGGNNISARTILVEILEVDASTSTVTMTQQNIYIP